MGIKSHTRAELGRDGGMDGWMDGWGRNSETGLHLTFAQHGVSWERTVFSFSEFFSQTKENTTILYVTPSTDLNLKWKSALGVVEISVNKRVSQICLFCKFNPTIRRWTHHAAKFMSRVMFFFLLSIRMWWKSELHKPAWSALVGVKQVTLRKCLCRCFIMWILSAVFSLTHRLWQRTMSKLSWYLHSWTFSHLYSYRQNYCFSPMLQVFILLKNKTEFTDLTVLWHFCHNEMKILSLSDKKWVYKHMHTKEINNCPETSAEQSFQHVRSNLWLVLTADHQTHPVFQRIRFRME